MIVWGLGYLKSKLTAYNNHIYYLPNKMINMLAQLLLHFDYYSSAWSNFRFLDLPIEPIDGNIIYISKL